METRCRFPSCQWIGGVDSIFDHCESYHRTFIREIDSRKKFTFTFDEFTKHTFLLNGEEGLYWFVIDDKMNCIRRGIFAIAESEKTEYTMKVGKMSDGYVCYFGPFETKSENSDEYDLEFTLMHLEHLNEEFPDKCMEIYFGPYEDPDEYTGTYEDVNWKDPKEVECNNWCLEKFTCFVCFEYIRKNARFCENRHFLCDECLKKLIEQNKLQCPMCRADFPYDCHDEKVEELLKCIRFPEDATEAQ